MNKLHIYQFISPSTQAILQVFTKVKFNGKLTVFGNFPYL